MSIKKSKLYTCTGDDGTSSLFNGERRPKCDARFYAIGSVDTLNAHIGVLYEKLCKEQRLGDTVSIEKNVAICNMLIRIMNVLFDTGANLATPIQTSSEQKLTRVGMLTDTVNFLNQDIDFLDSKLTPLRNFILPCGSENAAAAHVARCLCREAERKIVELHNSEDGPVDAVVLQYMNRLSDFLFVVARSIAEYQIPYVKQR